MLKSLFKAHSLKLDTYRIKKTRLYLAIPPKTLIILGNEQQVDDDGKNNEDSMY
jgi:hypothetical protein